MTTDQQPEDFSFLHPLFDEVNQKILAITKEFARINNILLGGFSKIQVLLSSKANIQKTEINDIIRDTLTQISPPK